jgi:plastocyanin
MKKQLLISLPVVVMVACILITGCTANTNPVSHNSTAASASTTRSTLSSDPSYTVTIKNFAFQPSTLTVGKGTTVTWVNEDSVGHTVTSNDGKFPSSGNLNNGDTYRVQFNDPGSYGYHCAPHPFMTGTINVN